VPVDEHLLSLPFDHYERYRVTAEIISLLWGPRARRRSILDVGGHFSSLKWSVPRHRVVAADPKERPGFTYRPQIPYRSDGYVRALGGSLPFGDRSFHLVTAHDTLEHVPEDDRRSFVEDMLRVANDFVILHGPIGHPPVRAAEQRVARIWEGTLEWTAHPLLEHFERGLPEPGAVEELLDELGTAWVPISNGNILVWLTMMAWQAHVLAMPDPEPLHEELDRAFNAEFADRDFGGTCYRTAFVVATSSAGADRLARVEEAFADRIASPPLLTDDHQADRLVERFNQHARRVRRVLRALRDDGERASMRAAELDGVVRSLRVALSERDWTVAGRDGRILELERLLQHRDAALRQRERELDAAATESDRLAGELARIEGSVAYRVAGGATSRMRNWFPPGTARGRALGRVRRQAYARLRGRKAPTRRAARTPDPWSVPLVRPQEYTDWIARTEPDQDELSRQRASAAKFPSRPLISVVMPTWNPPVRMLGQAVRSLREQTYDRWELCVADGGSAPPVREALRRLAGEDERIRVRSLDENRGIAGNTNAALEEAAGDFVAFLDHTDTLAPFALYRMAEALLRNPSLDILYSDWDLLTEGGEVRFNPFFTPQWSPDLLLSANYMPHLLVIRRTRIAEVGGLRPELDGAQDWDLLLRVTEHTDRVARIPGILYHWRADRTSAVMSLDTKPAAEAAQRRAVADRLARTGAPGTVARADDGNIRIHWDVQDDPKVSIIIPTRFNQLLLGRCLEGISRSSYPNREVVVVETSGRTEERTRWYEQLAPRHGLRVVWWEGPFNYSAVNNLAVRESTGDILVFLNDDTEPLRSDWLEELIGWVQRPGIGAVGAQLIGEDERIQHGGVIVGLSGFAEHLFRGLEPGTWTLMGSTEWYRNGSAITGACLAMSREVFDRVGGWDERFVLCGSDVELGLRVRKHGLRIVVDPWVKVRHTEAATRGPDIPSRDYCTSFWHYQGAIYGGDPYSNPALSRTASIPTFARPDDPSPATVVSTVLGRDVRPRPPGDEQRHTAGMVEACRVDPADLLAVEESHRSVSGRREVGSINWFVPDFDNPFYGGIHTIFRFADDLRRRHGVQSRFVVIGTGPEEYFRSGLRVSFPDLVDSDIFVVPEESEARLASVPAAEVSIASLWATVYPMVRWRSADRLFYFVQDFEPMFYPAGALSALAEETYRMGLYGIANTPPLKETYESFGGTAVSFLPCVDTDVFHDRRPHRRPDDPFTVFMYGRPGHPRNCYELAVAALRRLKESMGDRVRIVTAGSWSGDKDSEPWLDRLGLLDYRQTGDLYRRCDAGLVLSVSKHPTYIPLQLMASGALVVANDNPANGWLLRDGENSLLADPMADALAAALERGLDDQDLRAKLTERAVADIRDRHADWRPEVDRIYGFMGDPEG
jgi:O-antigen biosynthesis protein